MPQHDPPDPLHDLRDRVRATQEAAERLAADAAEAARVRAAGGVPPAGWATPQEHATMRDELEQLAGLLRALRELVPPELQAQVTEVLRQILLLVRALVDWWVERLEASAADRPGGAGARPSPVQAQDIPIE
jgi:hypothetical protein